MTLCMTNVSIAASRRSESKSFALGDLSIISTSVI